LEKIVTKVRGEDNRSCSQKGGLTSTKKGNTASPPPKVTPGLDRTVRQKKKEAALPEKGGDERMSLMCKKFQSRERGDFYPKRGGGGKELKWNGGKKGAESEPNTKRHQKERLKVADKPSGKRRAPPKKGVSI